ncbi:hypothetical protein BU54_23850 [Escherichia coli O45:H2 str. 2010C-4211]|nr:hypothetical protein BU54_23850 [Escherichia coli O45:H2 str. 2010C-4211]
MCANCRMRRERLIRPTVRHKPVGMIRRDKRRIRHYAPTAGCCLRRVNYPRTLNTAYVLLSNTSAISSSGSGRNSQSTSNTRTACSGRLGFP